MSVGQKGFRESQELLALKYRFHFKDFRLHPKWNLKQKISSRVVS